MKTFYKILLIIIAIAYLISPVDLIPDFLIPYVGWLDDAVVLWLIFYYLKFNRLPSFFYSDKKTGRNEQTGYNNYKKGSFSNGYDNSKTKKSPYEILGIDKNATEQDIRTAYRKLVKQYHPDRVASLGKEFQELANKKFIEIKDAYNTLMKSTKI